ncbi:MAG: aspartate-semialdehyde dehydrogenase [Longimicrobiales bacterium]
MKVALLGATGAVGRTMLQILEERAFPLTELVPLASERSAGSTVCWRGREWTVQTPSPQVFDGCAVALFSAGAARSREWAPQAAAQGAVVIDNSSAWRTNAQVPLVVPEVNGKRTRARPLGIIANPNCAVIQLVMALEALRRHAGLQRVIATTLQSVSGAGQHGLAALDAELAGQVYSDTPFVATIAHNVVPWIGSRAEDGWNEEELKIRQETRKIMELPDLPVAATCVRVPVRVGHSISATAELAQPISLAQAHAAFAHMTGLEHQPARDPLPREVAGTDCVRVGHVRVDNDRPNVIHFWVVADNLRKGAATNAVQIAEDVVRG